MGSRGFYTRPGEAVVSLASKWLVSGSEVFLSRPFQSSTVKSGDRRAIHASSVDSPASLPLAPSLVSEEEDVRLNRWRL